MIRKNILASILIVFLTLKSIQSASVRVVDDCQLLIVGGSTAAFGALLSASKLFDYNHVCLLEPTDWIGGQLTAELLSAPDFAWHSIRDPDGSVLNVREIDQALENQNPLFAKMLAVFGNAGRCHVSPACSMPSYFHSEVLLPEVNHTRIFYNTVIKRVHKDVSGRRITQIDAIQRTPSTSEQRCRFLSEELPDWYSPDDSAWFTKTELSFTNLSYVIEGTSWGEVLALANASYLQGLMEQFDGDISGEGNSTCGQAFTIGFLEKLYETPTDEPPNPLPEPSGEKNHTMDADTWTWVWTDRRVKSSAFNSSFVADNDVTIQNWGGGNDYKNEFFYLTPSETAKQRDTNQWQGGINLNAILEAERTAYSYHYWFRKVAPPQWTNRTVLVRSPALTGTCHFLGKLPYIRESRRSIGHNDFLMNITTIRGRARDLHGYIFPDRLCIGSYDADFHRMTNCSYPSYMTKSNPILPYYIPLRAMTNRDIDNLIPIGKTMAQSFLVNSAVRLHPVEFSIGQAAGVVGVYAIQNKIESVAQILAEQHIKRVQSIVKQFTPMSWTINGTRYPND